MIYGSYSKASSRPFFRFGVARPLHNVLTFIFRSLMEVPTARFTTSNSRVCPRVSYNIFWLPKHSSCISLRPLTPLLLVLSFLRLNCCLEDWFLIPVMLFGCARRLFPNVRPFEAPLATLSMVRKFPSFLFDRPSCMTASLTLCHSCRSGHPIADGGQLLPRPTIALGPFLRFSAAPYC
jgi:hypothetical protein